MSHNAKHIAEKKKKENLQFSPPSLFFRRERFLQRLIPILRLIPRSTHLIGLYTGQKRFKVSFYDLGRIQNLFFFMDFVECVMHLSFLMDFYILDYYHFLLKVDWKRDTPFIFFIFAVL